MKRPDARILTQPRKGVLTLTRDAQTAVSQSQVYGRALQPSKGGDQHLLMLGNPQFIFIIMGLSSELADHLGLQLYSDQAHGLLPGNCRLVPYDTLLSAFSATVPPRLMVLVPGAPNPLREGHLTFSELETSLRRLCTRALRTEWIAAPAGGRPLFDLDFFRAHSDRADPTPVARALRTYVGVAVARVEDQSHRIILEVVLGTGDKQWETKEWRRQTAQSRREIAGRRFRPDAYTVRPDTIRQIHEPRAIHELAQIIWKDELEARSEPTYPPLE